jgi:hypothetical protein
VLQPFIVELCKMSDPLQPLTKKFVSVDDDKYQAQLGSTMLTIETGILDTKSVDFECKFAEMYPYISNEGFELEDLNHKFPSVFKTVLPD